MSPRVLYACIMMVGMFTCLIAMFKPDGFLPSTVAKSHSIPIIIVCSTLFLFFFGMGLTTLVLKQLNVKTASSVQNRYWTRKLLIIASISFISYYSDAQLENFSLFCIYASLLGGFVFTLIQVVLLLEFNLYCIHPWLKNQEKASLLFRCCSYSFSALLYLFCCGVGLKLHFLYKTRSGDQNYFTCFWPAYLMILNSAFAFTPTNALLLYIWHSSLGHLRFVLASSSLIFAYVLLITWSAMPFTSGMDCHQLTSDFITINQGSTLHYQLILQLSLLVFSIVYLSKRKGYSWPAVHFLFSLASLYMMMILSDFTRLSSQEVIPSVVDQYELIFWVKLAASPLTVLFSMIFVDFIDPTILK